MTITSAAPVFIYPQELPTPLATLNAGTTVPVVESTPSWFLVRFNDTRWGPRVGYVHCAKVRDSSEGETQVAAYQADAPKSVTPTSQRR